MHGGCSVQNDSIELGTAKLMERRLGELGEPYGEGRVRQLKRASLGLTAAGAGVLWGATTAA